MLIRGANNSLCTHEQFTLEYTGSGTALKLHACTQCSITNDSHLAPVVKTLGMDNAVGFPKTLASQADVLSGSSRVPA